MHKGEWQNAITLFEEFVDKKHIRNTLTKVDGMIALMMAYLYTGQHEKSRELLKSLERFIDDLNPHYQPFLWSAKIRYHCLFDQKKAIQKLLGNQSILSLGIPFMYYEVPVNTECRALIFEGSESNLKLADEKLDELIQMNSTQHNIIHLIELYALQAILLDKQENFEASVTSFLKSIKLAEPGKVIACFVELGRPLMNIIDKLSTKIKEKDFIGEIIRAIESSSILQINQLPEKLLKESRKSQKEQLNIFTQSELAVLKCIAEGLRNQEIAEKLFNSEETIKKHIYHMFQKLQVKNRLSLVTKAKEEGLLE
jgi:ATP/maltotriose-dependent transcriptional regulator MalT